MKVLNKKPSPIIPFLFFLLSVSQFDACCQANVNISKPQLRFENNNLIIEYSILSGNPGDKFNVWLMITDSTGTRIDATYLSGDIGDSISAGVNKKIVWDLAAEQIFIDMGLFVEVKAERLIMPVAVPVEKKKEDKVIMADISKKDDIPQQIEEKEEKKNEEKEIVAVTEKKKKTVTSGEIGKNLLLSAIVPGLGLTRLSEGKPYWLLAFVDAGCVVTSIVYNRMASSSYEKYLNSYNVSEFDPYYDDASRQRTISRVFGWSALVIWVADMGLVTLKAINVDKKLKNATMSHIRIGSYIDCNTSTTCLSLYYSF
ncbi:MAG: hypothetical protein JW973_04305 [Bacteroidales bacterium]|nr:hypothetical protein [Bacteroidales bacterium]